MIHVHTTLRKNLISIFVHFPAVGALLGFDEWGRRCRRCRRCHGDGDELPLARLSPGTLLGGARLGVRMELRLPSDRKTRVPDPECVDPSFRVYPREKNRRCPVRGPRETAPRFTFLISVSVVRPTTGSAV